MMGPEEKGAPDTGGGSADNKTTDNSESSTQPTPFLDGATSGKVRPAPREPNVMHYRRRDSEAAP